MKVNTTNVRALLALGLTLDDLEFENGDILPAFKYSNSNPEKIRFNYQVLRVEKGVNGQKQILSVRPDETTIRKFNLKDIEFV